MMELVPSFLRFRHESLHPSTVEGWQPVRILSYWILRAIWMHIPCRPPPWDFMRLVCPKSLLFLYNFLPLKLYKKSILEVRHITRRSVFFYVPNPCKRAASKPKKGRTDNRTNQTKRDRPTAADGNQQTTKKRNAQRERTPNPSNPAIEHLFCCGFPVDS